MAIQQIQQATQASTMDPTCTKSTMFMILITQRLCQYQAIQVLNTCLVTLLGT